MAGKSDPFDDIIVLLGKSIYLVFACFFEGIREMKKKTPFIVFTATSAVVVVVFVLVHFFEIGDYTYVLYSAAPPTAVLLTLGAAKKQKQQNYKNAFAEAAFKGRDGQLPSYIDCNRSNGQETIYFNTNIPLEDWERNIKQLETSLNCNILDIQQGKSKRIIKLLIMSNKYALPEDIPWTDDLLIPKDGILKIGVNPMKEIVIDLNKTPHVLAAGETGSGKSVILRLMLWQMALKGSVLFMLDFKGGVEFGIEYETYGKVIMERDDAIELLELLVKENARRLAKFRAMKVKNLGKYNKNSSEKLSRIGVFCDELSEMTDKNGASKEEKEKIEKILGHLSTLARLSRATGINLFLGTQIPHATVLPGQIKNNIPVRICGRFADKTASEVVLSNTSAGKLPDIKGRFMFKSGADTVPFQAYNFDDEGIEEMVDEIGLYEQNVMTPELRKHLRTPITAKKEPREPARPKKGQEPKPDDTKLPAIRLAETPTKAKKGNKTGLDTDYEDCMEEM